MLVAMMEMVQLVKVEQVVKVVKVAKMLEEWLVVVKGVATIPHLG